MQYFNENADLSKVFTLNFLRMVVSALGLYSEDEIQKMKREKLGAIVNAARNVKFNDTLFSMLRSSDKLTYEYTTFVPLMGEIKKVIDFKLPASVIMSYNNNKRIVRSMIGDVDMDTDVDSEIDNWFN